MKLCEAYDGKRPASLDFFLDILQITEEEFMEILLKHQVNPHEFDPSVVSPGVPVPDMDKWDRTQVTHPPAGDREEDGKVRLYL